jgi:ribosomal protein S18 acetylase RimI-like enzyme
MRSPASDISQSAPQHLDPAGSPGPLGFVALRGAGRIGYELWLTAIGSAYRQKGIGKQMVGEALGMTIGSDVVVAQCDRFADGARRMAKILCDCGFECVREAKRSQWLARSTLPTEVKDWIKSAP